MKLHSLDRSNVGAKDIILFEITVVITLLPLFLKENVTHIFPINIYKLIIVHSCFYFYINFPKYKPFLHVIYSLP
jgi:hypothetical protein